MSESELTHCFWSIANVGHGWQTHACHRKQMIMRHGDVRTCCYLQQCWNTSVGNWLSCRLTGNKKAANWEYISQVRNDLCIFFYVPSNFICLDLFSIYLRKSIFDISEFAARFHTLNRKNDRKIGISFEGQILSWVH